MAKIGEPTQVPQANPEASLTPGAVEYSAENSATPGATAAPDATEEQLAALRANPTAMPEDFNRLKERQAFESYVQNQGEPIPSNFKDAGAWFDSLKEAQKNYTQGQQEIADLKGQYAEHDTVNPNYQEPQQTTEPVETAPLEDQELRIQQPVEEEFAPPTGITDDEWREWGLEIAVKGDLSPETRDVIKQKSGFSDNIIDDFLAGQKAKSREAYAGASEVVGGRERLDSIFKWAAENLSYEDQVQINIGLASPSYEITLRGLEATYSQATKATAKAQEPAPLRGTTNVADTQTGTVSYNSKREFYADRKNPRFTTDRAFRQAVEARMLKTDFNTLRD